MTETADRYRAANILPLIKPCGQTKTEDALVTGGALYTFMRQVVNSADGIKRAVRATNDGQPALAGVDELLRRELGAEYERANDGAWWAGFTVAQVMREMGFVEAGTGKCPPGCVASQGTIWRPRGLSGTECVPGTE